MDLTIPEKVGLAILAVLCAALIGAVIFAATQGHYEPLIGGAIAIPLAVGGMLGMRWIIDRYC